MSCGRHFSDTSGRTLNSFCPYHLVHKTLPARMSVIPKLRYRVNAVSTKIPVSYFVDVNKRILKFLQKGKKLRIAKTILKKSWWTDTAQVQDSLQIHSVVAAKAKENRSMEWRAHRQTYTNKCNSTLQRSKGNSMEKGKSFQQRMLEQIDIHVQKSANKSINLDTDLTPVIKLPQNGSQTCPGQCGSVGGSIIL